MPSGLNSRVRTAVGLLESHGSPHARVRPGGSRRCRVRAPAVDHKPHAVARRRRIGRLECASFFPPGRPAVHAAATGFLGRLLEEHYSVTQWSPSDTSSRPRRSRAGRPPRGSKVITDTEAWPAAREDTGTSPVTEVPGLAAAVRRSRVSRLGASLLRSRRSSAAGPGAARHVFGCVISSSVPRSAGLRHRSGQSPVYGQSQAAGERAGDDSSWGGELRGQGGAYAVAAVPAVVSTGRGRGDVRSRGQRRQPPATAPAPVGQHREDGSGLIPVARIAERWRTRHNREA